MAEFKMPEINSVVIAGNLTKDPTIRETSNNTPVVNFHVAVNRRYKDSNNQSQEDVCYVGVVAWNKLAESCKNRLKKGNAVLIDGELQSRTFKTEDNKSRTIVEIKAKRIQFLNKLSQNNNNGNGKDSFFEDSMEIEDSSFDKFLTDEESNLINED
ncbi:MAG: single-stranded DNA-binding protein [Bacteroidetes bacterium]|nr:single-stranded DNA-binding protein [Bacteroidota bacterium]MBU1115806.1 single-stranded DNA-binding protein [Bacteroidota bacterium]MBU1800199.1 single-stranded DNA-binding protein [Bacteroidota bacterium]